MTEAVECLACGKNMPATQGDMFAHVREHMDIENLGRSSGYLDTSDFPLQMRSVQDEYRRGQRDMLAKCIAAVKQLLHKPGAAGEHYLAALRALQEKP